jgi:hypothetical protein
MKKNKARRKPESLKKAKYILYIVVFIFVEEISPWGMEIHQELKEVQQIQTSVMLRRQRKDIYQRQFRLRN